MQISSYEYIPPSLEDSWEGELSNLFGASIALSRRGIYHGAAMEVLDYVPLTPQPPEMTEFLDALRVSTYTGNEKRKILSEKTLCYAHFVGAGCSKVETPRDNLVIYTLDQTGKITRWNTYYGRAIIQNQGEFDYFESRIPDLIENNFVFIPPGLGEFIN